MKKEIFEQIDAVLGAAKDGTGAVDIHNRKYLLVPTRLNTFLRQCPGGWVQTELVQLTDTMCVFKATVYDGDGKFLSDGYAMEQKASSQINKTSFLENCETSAVGRALAFAGVGSDNSIASADEVANAIRQQNAEAGLDEPIDDSQNMILQSLCHTFGLDLKAAFPAWPNITKRQFGEACARFQRLKDESKRKNHGSPVDVPGTPDTGNA